MVMSSAGINSNNNLVWEVSEKNSLCFAGCFSVLPLDPDRDPTIGLSFLRSQFSNVCQWDGSSFSGDIEEAASYNGTLIYRRGARIFDAVMEALLPLGMENAANAILAGSSAGGLATTLHCDRFRSYLPFVARLKKDLSNPNIREDYFGDIVTYHCIFPENLIGQVETPLFILNSAFDQYQIMMAEVCD